MFDIGWSELVVIAVVALIAIGPKELPGVLRMVGQWMGKARKMAAEFQGQFQEAMREAEMADLKKSFDEVREAASGFTAGNLMTSLDACALRDHAKVPVMIVLSAVERRSAAVYGPRAPRMVAFEAGAATENMLLEADALGLGCGAAVEFDAPNVASAVGLAPDETPKVVFTLARP